jgi:hypothetical protein
VNGIIVFLHLIEKPGEVHNGRPNLVNKPNVNIPERWGGNPGESVPNRDLAIVAETC